jgi:hypothetical protein
VSRIRIALLASAVLSASLGFRAQATAPAAPTPPPALTAPTATPTAPSAQGTSSDGRFFRILDRITREVDSLAIFRGRIPRALTFGHDPSGALTLCVNCEGKAPKETPKPETNPDSKREPKPDGAAKEPAAEVSAGGDLLLLDLKGMYDLRMEDGAFIYPNDDGFDADGREYGAYPTAGPDTGLTRLGSLLFLSNRSQAPGCPFKVALRSWGTTYLAPVGGCDQAPAKAVEADAGPEGLRDLTGDHLLKPTDWTARHKISLSYRDGAAACPLTSALAVLAAGKEDFLAVFDLRKLESARSSYFWMTQRPHRTVRLDQNAVTVEGSGEGASAYEPATFVEYPYLVVLGSYAKVRLAPAGGGPETVLTMGFCDECPKP